MYRVCQLWGIRVKRLTMQPQLNGKYLTMANRETSIIRRKQLNDKLLS